MDLWIFLGTPACGVDMVSPKVATELQGLGNEQVGEVPGKWRTLRWAARSASWSLPAGERLLSWVPKRTVPMLGVRSSVLAEGLRSPGKDLSAERGCSVWVKGWRGGYIWAGFQVGR